MLMKLYDKGENVFNLTEKLFDLGYGNTVTDVFDSKVEQSVKQFQERHIDFNSNPLDVDGIVGPLTWFALTGIDVETPDHLKVAIGELGRQEIGKNNSGKNVEKYLNGIAETPNNWCAGFVSWCFKESKKGIQFNYSLGARDIYNQFNKNGWILKDDEDIKPGDVVFWYRNSPNDWQGHIGIVSNNFYGILRVIEGNKGRFPAKVAIFQYDLQKMEKILGFGRVNVQ